MSCKKYEVLRGACVLAQGMELDLALLFIKAYCQEYYMEYVADQVKLTLREMEGEVDHELHG